MNAALIVGLAMALLCAGANGLVVWWARPGGHLHHLWFPWWNAFAAVFCPLVIFGVISW